MRRSAQARGRTSSPRPSLTTFHRGNHAQARQHRTELLRSRRRRRARILQAGVRRRRAGADPEAVNRSMNCWRLRQKRFVLLATALACSSEGSHAAKQSIARREISSAPVHVCTTPAGGIVVSLDSVAGLSTHATLGALRQQCAAGDSVLYDAVGWQAVAWAFPFAGARVTAVQSKHGFGDLVHDDEIPDLWTVEGDSVRLPDGHLVPQTLGLLRSRYGVTIVDENTGGDDIDRPTRSFMPVPLSPLRTQHHRYRAPGSRFGSSYARRHGRSRYHHDSILYRARAAQRTLMFRP